MNTNKKAAPQSSPLPCRTSRGESNGINIKSSDGSRCAYVHFTGNHPDLNEADAALIVRRVNEGPAFDALALVVARNVGAIHAEDGCRGDFCHACDLDAALKLAQEVR